jgi:predicted nuclease of predicted toxin-antitoxin system
MKILFDQGTPLPLRKFLSGHAVFTLRFLGWSTFSNGILLDKAERENFDCFVTTDRNLKYQQNLSTRKIAIFALSTTNWNLIRPRAFEIAAAIGNVKPGTYAEFAI